MTGGLIRFMPYVRAVFHDFEKWLFYLTHRMNTETKGNEERGAMFPNEVKQAKFSETNLNEIEIGDLHIRELKVIIRMVIETSREIHEQSDNFNRDKKY